jgi:hypothetical protein
MARADLIDVINEPPRTRPPRKVAPVEVMHA